MKKHAWVWGIAALAVGVALAGLAEVALAKVPRVSTVLTASGAFPGSKGKATFKVGEAGPELVVEVAIPALAGTTVNVSLGGVSVGPMTLDALGAGRLDVVSPTLGTSVASKAVEVKTADGTLAVSGTF